MCRSVNQLSDMKPNGSVQLPQCARAEKQSVSRSKAMGGINLVRCVAMFAVGKAKQYVVFWGKYR